MLHASLMPIIFSQRCVSGHFYAHIFISGNLAVNSIKGWKWKGWLRGGSSNAKVEKSLPSSGSGILQLLTNCALGRICVFSVALYWHLVRTSVQFTVANFLFCFTLYFLLWENSSTLCSLFKCDNMYLGIWCEHLCCCSAIVAFLFIGEWQHCEQWNVIHLYTSYLSSISYIVNNGAEM